MEINKYDFRVQRIQITLEKYFLSQTHWLLNSAI